MALIREKSEFFYKETFERLQKEGKDSVLHENDM